jgi:hypothetical protein
LATCFSVSASPVWTYALTIVTFSPATSMSASTQRPRESRVSSPSSMRQMSIGSRAAIATPARPFASASSLTMCQPGSVGEVRRLAAHLLQSQDVDVGGLEPRGMPLRTAARMPLTLTEATRFGHRQP